MTTRPLVVVLVAGALAWLPVPADGQVDADAQALATADSLVSVALEATSDTLAIRAFQLALDQPNLGSEVRGEILSYLIWPEIRTSSPNLPLHLWMLYRSGQSWELLDYALGALEAPGHRAWDGEEAAELLKLVAVGLAARFYEPTSFRESGIGARLGALAGGQSASATGRVIGDAINELLRWHDPNPWALAGTDELPLERDGERLVDGCSRGRLSALEDRPGVWGWWADTTRSLDVGMTREEAGRTLVRRLGNWYGEHGPDSAKVAESYLCVAAAVGTAPIMTAAFRDLVWTYVDANQIDPLKLLEAEFASQFHNSFDSEVPGDKTYLEPIEDALGWHPFYTNWKFWAVVTPTLYPLCRWVLKLGFCGGGDATGTVVITVPP